MSSSIEQSKHIGGEDRVSDDMESLLAVESMQDIPSWWVRLTDEFMMFVLCIVSPLEKSFGVLYCIARGAKVIIIL